MTVDVCSECGSNKLIGSLAASWISYTTSGICHNTMFKFLCLECGAESSITNGVVMKPGTVTVIENNENNP
jgi:hypothetical protein